MGEALAATPAPLAGQILGHVRSSSGVAQMGATVLLYNRYDQLVRQALTTEQGRFAFDALAPDLYSLRVTLASFMPALRRNIAVAAGSENVLQINLASVLSTVELVSSGASRGTLMSDDWKWVLRSAAGSRSVLQWDDSVVLTASNEVNKGAASPKVLVQFTDGARRPGSVSNVASAPGTAFAYDQKLGGASRLLVAGQVSYEDSPAGGVATVWLPTGTIGSGPHTALVLREAK
jgi:hypothetical protein